MANADTPFGLKPIKNAPFNEIPKNYYYIPSSYATALFIGDPVIKTGTSNTVAVTSAGRLFNPGSLPEINKATAGDTNKITGVIIGFLANPSDLSKNYNPASTERIAIVADSPLQEFEIQEESAGSPLAATSVGLNANVVFAESGSTTTGLSGVELDTTTPATDATFQLKILRLVDAPENAIGQHAKWRVKINNHTEANIVAGI
jgi:hypothetical protein